MKISDKDMDSFIWNSMFPKLRALKETQKVHLQKDFIENYLAFEKVKLKDGRMLKLPKYGFTVLQKIDLSDVSFDDVAWSLLFSHPEEFEKDYLKIIDKEAYEKTKELGLIPSYGCFPTKLSGTNAKIDFMKSFEYKNTGEIRLRNCYFSGVDLSNNELNSLTSVIDCDLSDTGICLTPEMLKNKGVVFFNTDLTNVDLSAFKISLEDLLSDKSPFSPDCNFTDTHLYLTVDPKSDFWSIKYRGYNPRPLLQEMMTRLEGCYINGKLIKSKEKRLEKATAKKEEYEKLKNDLRISVLNDIDDQISTMKMF